MPSPYSHVDKMYNAQQDFDYHLDSELENYISKDGTLICPECKTTIVFYDEDGRTPSDPGYDESTATLMSCENMCVEAESSEDAKHQITKLLSEKMRNTDPDF